MELDPKIMQQLLQTFSSELDSQIQMITDGLLKLEKNIEGDARRVVLEDIFRSAHNIKGAARGVGVLDVSEIAHHLESLFGEFKRDNKIPAAELIDLSLESIDYMRTAHSAFSNKIPLEFDLRALLQRIDDACGGVEDESAGSTEKSGKPGKKKTSKKTNKKISKKVGEGTAKIAKPTLITNEDASLQSQTATVKEAKELSPEPLAKPVVSENTTAEFIRLSTDKLEAVAATGEELQVSKIEMEDHLKSINELKSRLEAFTNMWTRAGFVLRHHKKGLPTDVARLLDHSLDNIIELDKLGEQIHKEMRSSTSRLGILTNNMQTDIRLMRLVPVSSLLRPLARTVRDVARELGKQVDYQVIGDEIEMDRSVLDEVRDPVMHLLRNAIDHGLESPEERKVAGKPVTGKLSVQVQAEGSKIYMIIKDDGRGIDVEKVAAAAEKRKLVTDTELSAMSDEEMLDLVFHPGFSSKEIVTNVSGRGVGLDVVRSNLRKLKGRVQMDTIPGEGTTFTLHLPLTLATEHGLMVRAGGNAYAIPTTSVNSVMELHPDNIIDVEASQAVLVDGQAVPLYRLSGLLEVGSNEPLSMESIPVVIISKGWDTVALLVDEILGEREIVIKTLQPPLVSVRNVTGGTLTGSGDIIMVLNPSNLVDSALKTALMSRVLSTDNGSNESQDIPHILVVDDSITTRNLEKNILEVAGYRVTTAVDGVNGWDVLQEKDFDLVVTDIEMPKMNGFDLTERIKQSEKFSELPVIIVSSLANEADQQRGIEVGANAYIVKGEFETRALLDVVRQMV
jgi:two-component system chemotaxis sensor kinase CheA